ncbi:MAG: site-2 protease family protein [Gammaproteobacteria bacterium]
MSLTSIIVYAIGIVLVLLAGLAGSAVNQLMGIRVQRPRIRPDNQPEPAGSLQELYQGAIKQLSELGFETHHWQQTRDIVAHEYADKTALVMIHRQTRVFAEISPASTFLDLPGYEVDFWSIAKDGSALITVNGRAHSLLCEIPGATTYDPMVSTLPEQFKAHLAEYAEKFANKPAVIISASSYIKLQQKLLDAYFLKLMKEGSIVSTGNNEFRLSLRKTVNILPRFIKGDLKAQKLLRNRLAQQEKRRRKAVNSSQAIPAASADTYSINSEVQAYLRLSSARERNPAGLASKLIMFVVTLGLSYFAFGLVFSFTSVLILLGVILFHELGHVAAMYAFKYRDLQILFIPLLGAAATGKKDKVAVWKQVIVYLMGPLPGIVTGIGLIVLYQQIQWQWLYETAIIMLIINYLNLLPFVPLDGGHIVRLTIMERFPTGKLLFIGLSGVAFAAGGWFLGEPIFWVLAIVMLVSLPWSAMEAGVLNELYQQSHFFDDLDKQGKLTKLFEVLRQPRFQKLHFAQKYDLAKSLSEVLLQPRHLGRLGTLGLAGMYISALLLAPPAVMITTVGLENTYNVIALMSGNNPVKDWDVEIAEADSPEGRFDKMLDASQFYTATNNLPKALDYINQAETTFSVINTDSGLSRLYQAYSTYYQFKQDYPRAESYQQKIIKLHRQAPHRYTLELANDYQTLATLFLQQDKREGLESVLNSGLSYALQIDKPEKRYIISIITGELLDLYYDKQRIDDAQTMLDDTVAKLEQHHDPLDKYVTNYLYQELGWLSAKQNDIESAMKYFVKALSLMTGKADPLNDLSINKHLATGSEADPMGVANVMLAMAAVQYQKGNMSISQEYLQEAEYLVKNNYFESLGQYIGTYTQGTGDLQSDQPEKINTRQSKRWTLINDVHRYFSPKKTASAQNN